MPKLPLPIEDDSIREYDELQTNQINDDIDEISSIKQSILTILEKLGLISDWVVESGTNANGNYEKWNSGKLVQWGSVSANIGAFSVPIGNGYFRALPMSQVFPIPFIGDIPKVLTDTYTQTPSFKYRNAGPSLTQTGAVVLARWASTTTDNTGNFDWLAIGTWK